MDIKERIEKAKERLEAAKNAKTKAETQLEAAQEQCDKVGNEAVRRYTGYDRSRNYPFVGICRRKP